MDAEQHGVLRVLDPGRPVVEIRHLLLPQGIGVRVVKGDVLAAQQERGLAVEPQELIQLAHDGQIDPAFNRTGGGNRAPIFPAVARVQDQGSPLAAGRSKHRLRPSGPQPEVIGRPQHKHGQEKPSANSSEYHRYRPLSITV